MSTQEVIMTAAIRNNYSIVKVLHGDGYRIFEKLADDRFFFSEGLKNTLDAKIQCVS
jgi:hypothetical protein